ncbi:tetratricopeptide repeat protein [Crateriforma conspicua]|nr:tetratricopeptide repeat protein [Crateriforma conspicua]
MRRSIHLVPSIVMALVLATVASEQIVVAQDDAADAASTDEQAMALYADAANFQTAGAVKLAIESWQAFLDRFPDHKMASGAAHYLGVCYMQQEKPDYQAAAKSFARALRDKTYDLREESLSNLGWCLYATAGPAPDWDQDKLRQAISVLGTLRKEFPESPFLDRADYYTAESYFGLGQTQKAIEYLDRLLSAADAKESPLRCEALYSRGIAYEGQRDFDKAIASYRQLIDVCDDSGLVADVHLRMGDIAILNGQFGDAIDSFQLAENQASADQDKAYAIYRHAFALAKSNQPGKAAELYERLIQEHGDSSYATAAILASAQSTYRSGNIDLASQRFERVLEKGNPTAATEAAHWLARIALSENDAKAAAEIARKQIARGIEGDFGTPLRLDLADALAADPTTIAQARDEFGAITTDNPKDPLAPRALYNAAFFSLQLGDVEQAIRQGEQFLDQYSEDELAADVRFVVAESLLRQGDVKQAVQRYEELINSQKDRDNPQRPLWVIRGAASMQSAGQAEAAIDMLRREVDRLPQSAQKAEASLMIGQALLATGKPSSAVAAFGKSLEYNDQWARSSEARLLRGVAFQADGKSDQAAQVWTELSADDSDPRMADQAIFKLGQLAANQGDHATAIAEFGKILDRRNDPNLLPYAQYAQARSFIADKQPERAESQLDAWTDAYPNHSLKADVLTSLASVKRLLGKDDQASELLQQAASSTASSMTSAAVLFESAMLDQENERYDDAIEKFLRIRSEHPNYAASDRVMFELAWSYKEADQTQQAESEFKNFLKQFPDSPLGVDAKYFLAQQAYQRDQWQVAADLYSQAAQAADDPEMSEKSLYRLGWAHFKDGDYADARDAFSRQADQHRGGAYLMDALMMIGECDFKRKDFDAALDSYTRARTRIENADESAQSLSQDDERQVRELILLHGGQCAAQLKRWDEALDWYQELRTRFPNTDYLSQVFYEIAFANQQKGDVDQALQFYGQVAQKYRNSVAARSRFMMGEIHFEAGRLDKAIEEFQRVMFGFGAEKASKGIKVWQAKSGYEAARCSERLMQQARTEQSKKRAKEIAVQFYRYVVEKHPTDEMAERAQQRLKTL